MTVLTLHRRALLALILLAALTLVPAPGAHASCAAPLLVAKHDTSHTGSDYWRYLSVTGKHFMDGCNDTGGSAAGPFGCAGHTESEPVRPLEGVILKVGQNGRSWVLDVADADAQGDVSWSATLPDELEPGPATLVAAGGELQIDVPKIKSGRQGATGR